MRDIKFRGKDKKNKWHYYIVNSFPINPDTIGQYT